MSNVVLDASAVLAILRGEPGSDFVLRSLNGAVASTVNIAEVLCVAEQKGSTSRDAMRMVRQLQIRHVPFDDEQASLVATINKATMGGNIGFADRACMALGLSRRLPVFTSDREWKKYNTGVEIVLIR